MKTEITLRIDAELAREARIIAARQGTSLSRLMADQLEVLTQRDRQYESAKRRALDRLETGFDLGWKPPADRGEIYGRQERGSLR